MAWTLPPDTDPVALHRAAAGQAAPCPALVEVGTIDDRALLVDLESPSSTAIVGDAAAARRLLLSLTYGLATTRSEEHTSELQSLMRISYAVFCLKKQKPNNTK